MIYYSYDDFRADMKSLLKQVDFQPDAILAIARGGMTMAHFLGIAMNMNEVYTVNAVSYTGKEQNDDIKIFNIPDLHGAKKVLVVDEIIDSGKSMHKILEVMGEINPDAEFKSAVIFYKPDALYLPHFYIREAPEWIDFFWEVDLI